MSKMNWRRAAIMGCAAALGIWALVVSVPGFAQDSTPMGPKDVAEIPIESVPDWASEGVVNPVSRFKGADIQILAVLKDPRGVPVDRFIYALTDDGEVIPHPLANQIRDRFPDGTGAAVAVYVRVTADEITEDEYAVFDPFFIDAIEFQERSGWINAPWRAIGVSYMEDPQLVLPCLEPITIEEGARAFNAPDTGTRISPDEYLPPRPHYEVVDQTSVYGKVQGEMDSEEVREGWMLCLAPEVPVDQIRVVYSGNLFQELGTYGQGRPYWERRDELQTGEWARFEDQVVVGWNGELDKDINGVLQLENETVVYEGDVWVSVAQALRYESEDEFFLQLYFDEMEELLETWEQIALMNLFEVEICEDIEGQVCGSRFNLHIQAIGERIDRRISPESEPMAQEAVQDTAWIRLGELKKDGTFPDHKIWRVDIVLADEDGGKNTDYAPGKCISPEEISIDSPFIKPHYFNDTGEVPIIPLGEMANGIRVVRAWFVSGEVLRLTRLDIILRERDDFDPANSKWLLIEVQSQIEANNNFEVTSLSVLGMTDGEWRYIGDVGSEAYYGTSAGYEVAGNTWDSITRAATQNAVLVGKVPMNWQMEDLLIAPEEGPAWRLR
jgi:hypothetical protein